MPVPVTRIGLGISNCRPASDVVAQVKFAEDLGAEVAFIAEDVNCRDSFELCAVAAMETRVIRLATGVVNPFTRNPTSLAMAIATLDELSEGRAVLGMGISSPSLIHTQMGIQMGKPLEVMREATEIVRALLSGETVTRAGRHFVYCDAVLSVRPVQARIPVFFAAMGPQMLRLAGKTADGVLLNVGASTDYVRWAVQQVRSGAESSGREPGDITIAAWLTAYVTPDREAGVQRAREWLAAMFSIPRQGELLLEHGGGDVSILPAIRAAVQAYPHAGDRAAAARHVPVDMAEKMTLVGTPDEVRDRLQEYRAAGVDLPVLGPAALSALYPSPSSY